jgi:hypothetical protein
MAKEFKNVAEQLEPEVFIYVHEAETVCIMQLVQIWIDFAIFYYEKIQYIEKNIAKK